MSCPLCLCTHTIYTTSAAATTANITGPTEYKDPISFSPLFVPHWQRTNPLVPSYLVPSRSLQHTVSSVAPVRAQPGHQTATNKESAASGVYGCKRKEEKKGFDCSKRSSQRLCVANLGRYTIHTLLISILLDYVNFHSTISTVPPVSLAYKSIPIQLSFNLGSALCFLSRELCDIVSESGSLLSISLSENFSSITVMATEWSLDFCLVCDRQTLGGPYCSQTCRLAELDLVSSKQSFPSSKTSTTTTKSSRSHSSRSLSPSSSQTSLSSLRSNASLNSALSNQFQNELRDYASCFDHVRDLKRRMTS